MDFKPNDFFIGLVEFVTILLPGASLAMIFLWVDMNHPLNANQFLYQYIFAEKTSILFWVIFLFASFGFGYFLSSIASGLDPLYDVIRKQLYPYGEDLRVSFKRYCVTPAEKEKYKQAYFKSLLEKQKKECLPEMPTSELNEEEKIFEGYLLSYKKNMIRRIFVVFFEVESVIRIDKSYDEARKIMHEQPESVRNAANVYKWAGTILQAHYPSISDQAIRIMAASKFFRSLVVVSLFFVLLQLVGYIPFDHWMINLVVLILSLREYVVQRQKSVQKTYQGVVTLMKYNGGESGWKESTKEK